MLKKWIAGLLILPVLLTAGALLAGCEQTDDGTETASDSVSAPINSARAVDQGELLYYLDDDGTLWVSCDGNADKIAALDAEQIALVGQELWYAAGEKLYSYSLESGESVLLCSLPDAIDSFSVCEENFYCLAQGALYCKEGDLVADFKGQTAPDGMSLSGVQRMSMDQADEVILYLPNPDYVEEDGVEELPEDGNDMLLTYSYSLVTNLLSIIDQFENSDMPSSTASSGSFVINGVTLPFADYPVGSYFSQNGRACTCHAGDCVTNTQSNENCIRYWPSKANCQIDLKGVQCMGFARFCQWRLYGSIDFSNTTDYYNAFGSKLSAGKWTANTVKTTLTKVGPGGHIRTGAGHSLFVISVSASGFITYECNTNNKDCLIYTRQWTWDSFYSYCGSRDLMYYNMPRSIDQSGAVTSPEDEYKTGSYQVVANGGLNLRAETNTTSSILATVPQGAIINVSIVQKVGSYYWGYTQYNGKYGWVRLDYTLYQNSSVSGIRITTPPSKTVYTVGDSFSTAGMVVEAAFTNGTAFEIVGYTCSGYNMNSAGTYTVKVTYGSFSDSFTIQVLQKIIQPTSVTLATSSVTLIVGDSYQLGYTILPADATEKEVTWSASAPAVASIEGSVVSAKSPGSSVITIQTKNGLKATCRVTVITMPTGINWSTTADGEPLYELPEGIRSEDYSIRYRLPQGNDWGEWIYTTPPQEVSGYQCQFRAFTATFVNTLDGNTVEQFTVELNEVITFSQHAMSKEGYLFTGWYTDPQAAQAHDSTKACSSQVTITGDLLVYAGWIELGSITADSDDSLASAVQLPEFGMAGVELRVSDDATGLRFLARISTDLIRELESLHSSNKNFQPSDSNDTGIGYGMVVRLKDKVSGALNKDTESYLYKGSAVTVPAYRTYAAYNGYLVYNAFVCGFTSEYYKTDFVARPYLTYADVNGNIHTYYFTCTGSQTQGGGYYTNLYAEAQKLADNPTTDAATKRWLEDNILK